MAESTSRQSFLHGPFCNTNRFLALCSNRWVWEHLFSRNSVRRSVSRAEIQQTKQQLKKPNSSSEKLALVLSLPSYLLLTQASRGVQSPQTAAGSEAWGIRHLRCPTWVRFCAGCKHFYLPAFISATSPALVLIFIVCSLLDREIFHMPYSCCRLLKSSFLPLFFKFSKYYNNLQLAF